MPSKRAQPTGTPRDFSAEKAYTVLSAQLEKLQLMKGRSYEEAKADEDEWWQLTEKLVLRSFGSESTNYSNFRRGRAAGEHQMRLYGEPIPVCGELLISVENQQFATHRVEIGDAYGNRR